MQTTNLSVGSYGIDADSLRSRFEDGCVGSPPDFTQGIVVSRIEGEKIYVRDWHIHTHFTGEHSLEQFEEAKTNREFDFTFSREREIDQGDTFVGEDPVFQKRLMSQLKKMA